LNAAIDYDKSWVDFGEGHFSLSDFCSFAICVTGQKGLPGDNNWSEDRSYFAAAYSDKKVISAQFVVNVPGVPEPETYAMLLAGLGIVGTIARRRSKLDCR
jgi:hypothetical protein